MFPWCRRQRMYTHTHTCWACCWPRQHTLVAAHTSPQWMCWWCFKGSLVTTSSNQCQRHRNNASILRCCQSMRSQGTTGTTAAEGGPQSSPGSARLAGSRTARLVPDDAPRQARTQRRQAGIAKDPETRTQTLTPPKCCMAHPTSPDQEPNARAALLAARAQGRARPGQPPSPGQPRTRLQGCTHMYMARRERGGHGASASAGGWVGG